MNRVILSYSCNVFTREETYNNVQCNIRLSETSIIRSLIIQVIDYPRIARVYIQITVSTNFIREYNIFHKRTIETSSIDFSFLPRFLFKLKKIAYKITYSFNRFIVTFMVGEQFEVNSLRG